ncbi:MAG: hypothetical protein AAF221_01345 [Pseudomonadota bacterium]
MNAQIYDTLAQTLAKVRKDYGAEVLKSRRRLNGVLADRMPDNKREIRVLLDAVDDGALKTFESTSADQVGMQIDRLAGVMESQRGTRLDLARQVIAACAYAVGVGKLPSQLYGDPAPTPASGGQDDWVGVSEVVGAQTATQTPERNQEPSGPAMEKAKLWFEENKLLVTLASLALVIGGIAVQSGVFNGGGDDPYEQGGGGQVQVSFPQYDEALGYFGELADLNVPAQTTPFAQLEGVVPLTIPGGDTVTTQALIDQGLGGNNFAIINAWAQNHDEALPYSYNMPFAGLPGTFQDETQQRLMRALEDITKGKRDFPLVFYSKNVARTDGYNAALRAINAGYLNVFWYRGGLESFKAAGQGTVQINKG